MALKLFGLKRRPDPAPAAKPAEPTLEFEEVARPPAPAAAAPAKRKRALSRKQVAQRKYAAGMKSVRARAKSTKGGKGRIAKRAGATRLRRRLGLKPGAAAKKGGKKTR